MCRYPVPHEAGIGLAPHLGMGYDEAERGEHEHCGWLFFVTGNASWVPGTKIAASNLA